MKRLLFTLVCAFFISYCINAQDANIKLIGSSSGNNITQLQQTREGNLLMLYGQYFFNTGESYKTVSLLSPSGDTLWTTVLSDTTGSYEFIKQWSVVQAPGNGYIVVGNAVSVLFLMKLDNNGKLRRVQKVTNKAGGWQNIGKGAITADGKLLLCGEQDALKNKHAFLLKIDPDTGTLLWAKALGTDNGGGFRQSEAFIGLLPAKDSGSIVCGTDSRMGGDADFLYAEYDKNGTVEWIKRVQTQYSSLPNDLREVAEAADGGLVFFGTAGLKGRYYNFIFKTDGVGNPLWLRRIENPMEDRSGPMTGIVANADNSYTATGYYKHAGLHRIVGMVCNLNGNGDLQWYHLLSSVELKTKGGIQKRDVYFNDIQKAGDGGYNIGGYVGFGAGGGISATDSMLLVKLDNAGNSCRDSAAAGIATPLTFTMPSYTFETADIADFIKIKDTVLFAAGAATFGVRYACDDAVAESITAAATGNIVQPALSFSIYPNPVVNNQLAIRLTNAGQGSVYLHINDINGKTVYTGKIMTASAQTTQIINIANLAGGIYFISINNGKTTTTSKFIKQ